MSLALYMDEHIPGAITRELRRRGVDVLTVQEDGRVGTDDVAVLGRAGGLARVVVTEDQHFLAETTRRQHAGEAFAGVIFGTNLQRCLGVAVRDLQLVAEASAPDELANQVVHVPL